MRQRAEVLGARLPWIGSQKLAHGLQFPPP
jgi:hypothetical protein